MQMLLGSVSGPALCIVKKIANIENFGRKATIIIDRKFYIGFKSSGLGEETNAVSLTNPSSLGNCVVAPPPPLPQHWMVHCHP